MKKIVIRPVLLLLALTLIISPFFDISVASSLQIRVDEGPLRVRTEPWGASLGTVQRGETYDVQATKKDSDGKDWYLISASVGQGYIASWYTSPVGSSTAPASPLPIDSKRVRIITKTLNYRTIPAAGEVLGTLKRDQVFEVLKTISIQGKDWYEIKHDNKTVYIAGYLAKTYQPGENHELKPTGKKAVMITGLLVRDQAGGGTVIGQTRQAQSYDIYETQTVLGKPWYRISYQNSWGYVAGWLCKLDDQGEYRPGEGDDQTPVKKAYIKTVSLVVRDQVGGGNIIGYAKLGQAYDVIQVIENIKGYPWYQIHFNGKTAYMAGWLTSDTPPELPSGDHGKIRIITYGLKVRNMAGGGDVIGEAKKGEIYDVISITESVPGKPWYGIRFSGSIGYVAGWLTSTPSREISEEFTRQLKVTAYGLKVRSTPGGELLGTASFGKVYPWTGNLVTDQGSTWHKIRFNGQTGWIVKGYADQVTTDSSYYARQYKMIHVPYTSQLSPTFAPVGCEAAGMHMLLRAHGYARNTSYRQFLDAMPRHRSNPAYGYVGSPYARNWNLKQSILPRPLTAYANSYAGGRAKNITGATINEIKDHVIAGRPVLVYATIDFGEPTYKTWYIDGVPTVFHRNNHIVVVSGWNGSTGRFRITDPLSSSGARYEYTVSESWFARIFNDRNRKEAIVIE